MSAALKINITGDALSAIDALRKSLGDLTSVNQRIANAEEAFFRDYLREIASGRHKTARRLGANPTGYFEDAAESPEGTATRSGVTIALSPAEAFSRAFRTVVITPRGGKKWLTIPATAAAYGRRAGEFAGTLKFVKLGPDLAALMSRAKFDGKNKVFYWLKKEITQPQERELLPSDEAIEEIAVDEIETAFLKLFTTGGASI